MALSVEHQTVSASGRFIMRRAQPAEATVLSELALRSKAHWEYTSEFIAACRAELTVTPEMIAAGHFYLVIDATTNRVAGFYSLQIDGAAAELVHCFVAPEFIGRGIGKLLWLHALETARGLNVETIEIESDPHAEGFYLACGAERVGTKESQLFTGRRLPLLRYLI